MNPQRACVTLPVGFKLFSMIPQNSLRHVLVLFSAAGLITAASAKELPVAKPESVGMSSVKLEKVDSAVQSLIDQKKLAGASVMITRHGKVAYFKTFGKADVETDKPMREDNIFRIYSMTKAITTTGAMILHEEGKLGLDDPISNYLPEFKGVQVWSAEGPHAPKREPTIRDLMRHTAGLTYGESSDAALAKIYREASLHNPQDDLAAMCGKLGKLPLQYEPGTRWIYSLAVDVLGRVIEVVSGQTLDVFLSERIFAPLDMKDSGFFVPTEKLDRVASLYNSNGKGELKSAGATANQNTGTKPKNLSGGGGLMSTTRDYTRFLQMMANGGELDGKRLLKAETVSLMTHNQLAPEAMPIAFGAQKREGIGFGLGFNVRVEPSTKWDPAAPVGEYGWGGMASTHYWVSPKDDLVVVTMEQTLPYSFQLEWQIKGLVYDAIEK